MNTKSIRFAAVMAAVIGAFAFQASAATVTTTGTGVGKDGDIKVQVTFDANKIQSIKVLSQNENPVLAEKVFTDLKDNVVKTPTVKRADILPVTLSLSVLLYHNPLCSLYNQLQRRSFPDYLPD